MGKDNDLKKERKIGQIIEESINHRVVYKSKRQSLSLFFYLLCLSVIPITFGIIMKSKVYINVVQTLLLITVFPLIMFYIAYKLNRLLLCNKVMIEDKENAYLNFYETYLTMEKYEYDSETNKVDYKVIMKILYRDIVYIAYENNDNSYFEMRVKKYERLFGYEEEMDREINRFETLDNDMFNERHDFINEFRRYIPNTRFLNMDSQADEIDELSNEYIPDISKKETY